MDQRTFNKWLRKTSVVIDQLERIQSDPLQHLTPLECENYMLDILEATDEMMGTDFANRYKEKPC
jgi:hypothetical protein